MAVMRGPFLAGRRRESAQRDTLTFDIYRTNRRVYLRGTFLFGISNARPEPKETKDETMTTSLGAKIKRHRQEKGYSLDKLAELTDSSKSYIWELENRDTRKPSGEKLTRIAQALEVTTDYLLDESEEPSDQVLKEAFFRKYIKKNHTSLSHTAICIRQSTV